MDIGKLLRAIKIIKKETKNFKIKKNKVVANFAIALIHLIKLIK